MSRSQQTVEIIERQTGNLVTAVLHTELEELELIDVEIAWAPERLIALRELRQKGATAIPQHVHWNWALKAIKHSNLLAFRSFGIEAAGKMQGLMLVWLTSKVARLDPDKGKPLIYVDFVETAPWNAKEFTANPIYKGIGLRLIQAVARSSIDEGYKGRDGLHSLAQSTPFYTAACEMTSLGPDSSYHGLNYLELTAVRLCCRQNSRTLSPLACCLATVSRQADSFSALRRDLRCAIDRAPAPCPASEMPTGCAA